MTSSTIASKPGGMTKPNRLAVFILITNSKAVGASIGSSLGLVPLRMRPA